MASDSTTIPEPGADTVELPGPTAAPMVLSMGLVLLAAGAIMGLSFLVSGAAVLVVGLGLWIADLLPGRGHVHEPLVEPSRRPAGVRAEPGMVARLDTGMPGYRLRLPEKVHPISAGIKGGILGGLVMPIPALAYGVLSGHGIWYPVNLLAGIVLPGVGRMTIPALERFHPSMLLVAVVVHAVNSVVFGMIYGVLLPTLPQIPRAMAWAGLLMPVLWTGVSYGLMRVVNPALNAGVGWPYFIASQFLYGIVVAAVFLRVGARRPVLAGLLGGIVGGLLMPIPALLWGVLTGRGVWYPINLLAGMIVRRMGTEPPAELMRFHAEWLLAATAIHAVLAPGFGLLLGLLAPRLPTIPGPMAWGGLLLPVLWTGASFGLMGVVNPLLQGLVDWPWFIVSQFVYGVVASIVVLRSQKIAIPPAGRGPEPMAEYVAGTDEERS